MNFKYSRTDELSYMGLAKVLDKRVASITQL